MAAQIEIERKFLVLKSPPQKPDRCHRITQAYIAREGGTTVRVRQKDDRYILGIKTTRAGDGRHELEYDISRTDAEILFASSSKQLIEKTRDIYELDGHIWEVDVFSGANQGLVVAEVELDSLDEKVILPDWIGPEVTHLSKFYNANLSELPFKNWGVSYAGLLERLQD